MQLPFDDFLIIACWAIQTIRGSMIHEPPEGWQLQILPRLLPKTNKNDNAGDVIDRHILQFVHLNDKMPHNQ